jgi:hypothetical protein
MKLRRSWCCAERASEGARATSSQRIVRDVLLRVLRLIVVQMPGRRRGYLGNVFTLVLVIAANDESGEVVRLSLE